MPENLKIIIEADVVKAVGGLDAFVTKLKQSNTEGQKFADQLTTGFKKAETTATRSFQGLSDAIGKLNAQQRAFTPARGLDSFIGSLNKSKGALASFTTSSNQSSQALLNLGRVAQDAPFGFIGIANNLNPLIESLQRASVAAKETGTSLAKSLLGSLKGAGGLGLAVSVVSSALLVFGGRLFGAGKQAKEAAERAKEAAAALKELVRPMNEIRGLATAGVQDEISKVQVLSSVVLNQTKSYTERNNALKELKRINESYFGDLTLEAAKLGLLRDRVNEYTQAIIAQAVIKGFDVEIGKTAVELSKQRGELEKTRAKLEQYQKTASDAKDATVDLNAATGAFTPGIVLAPGAKDAAKDLNKVTKAYNEQERVVDILIGQQANLKLEIQKAIEASLKFRPLQVDKTGAIKDLKDLTDEIIARGKALAKFFEEILIVPRFSILDTKKEAFAKAKKFIDELAAGLITIKMPPLKIRPDIIVQANEVPIIVEPVLNQKSIDNFFSDLKGRFSEPFKLDLTLSPSITKNIDTIIERLREFGSRGVDIILGIDTKNFDKGINDAITKLTALQIIGKDRALFLSDKTFVKFNAELEKSIEKIDSLKLPQGIEDQLLGLLNAFSEFGVRGAKVFDSIKFDNINDGIKNAVKQFKSLQEEFAVTQEFANILGNSFATMFDALIEGKDPIKAFFNFMIQELQRLIAKLIATKIAALLMNLAFAGAGGGAGGAIGALTGGHHIANPGLLNQLGGSISARSFGNTFSVIVNGRVSGDQIILAGGRALASQGRTG